MSSNSNGPLHGRSTICTTGLLSNYTAPVQFFLVHSSASLRCHRPKLEGSVCLPEHPINYTVYARAMYMYVTARQQVLQI